VIPYRQLDNRCDSGQPPLPDADLERVRLAFHNVALHFQWDDSTYVHILQADKKRSEGIFT
jgi:hypothetical protein